MKIAVIAPTEIPARRANTLQVMKMSQAFQELGHQVITLVPCSSQGISPDSDRARSWESLAHHYGLKHPLNIEWMAAHKNLRRYDFSWRALKRAQNWGSQIIYTRLPQTAAIASLTGFPTIFEIHDYPQGKIGPFLLRTFLSGRGARRLVVITRTLHDDLSANFQIPAEKNFTIIAPDGVDIKRYQDLPDPLQARKQLSSNPSPNISKNIRYPENFVSQFTAGYSGHLYPGRGTQLLLEMAAQLPHINFLIVGGEPQDVIRLQQAADQHNLKNFLLPGFIPNSELPSLQAACDVLLMPYQEKVSASSGGNIARYLSPMKLFEYMACRRAILSSNLPVLQEILNAQNSVLLPPKDVQSWVNAINHLLANPELCDRLAKQARQDVTQFTWQARAVRILDGIKYS